MIQIGAELAVLLYFRARHLADRGRLVARRCSTRSTAATSTTGSGWYIIVGSIPIGIVGFLGKDVISGPLPLAVVGRRRADRAGAS